MQRFASIAAASFAALVLLAPPDRATAGTVELAGVEISAQQADPVMRRRARARIRVNPVYPRQNFNALVPLPEGVNYPGPNAVRECSFRLVQEYRPSGTVIVPRQRCWWARRY